MIPQERVPRERARRVHGAAGGGWRVPPATPQGPQEGGGLHRHRAGGRGAGAGAAVGGPRPLCRLRRRAGPAGVRRAQGRRREQLMRADRREA
eukprot:254783-Pyramimonas_sp.AAC.1